MSFTRLGLQGKIIAIIAATVILVVGVSTYIAMWLTRLPVEEEIYRKALQQARLTAYQLADKGALQNPQDLLSVRSEERRVGKECRSRRSAHQYDTIDGKNDTERTSER